MAQSKADAKAETTRVYIPEPGLHVQTVSSDQYPGGRVYHLTHGFTDLPEEIAKNPVMLHLAKSPEETAEMEAAAKAETARLDALAAAHAEYTAETIKRQDAQLETMYKSDVERAARVDAASAKGDPTAPEDELPADPHAARALVLTQHTMHGMVSAAGMATKHPIEVAYEPPTPPAGPPVNRDVPYVSGDTVVAGILACTMGNWENEPTGYAYQWKSNEAAVGISSPNYTVATSDAGHTIVCVVTATNILGSTEAPPSNAVVIAGGNGTTNGNGVTASGTRRAVA
jgi:hypothetical protein